MNKREYDRRMKELNSRQESIQLQRAAITRLFKQTCVHPRKSLDVAINQYEDEYGKVQASWKDYTYFCRRCGTHLPKRKVPFKSLKDLRASLNNENA